MLNAELISHLAFLISNFYYRADSSNRKREPQQHQRHFGRIAKNGAGYGRRDSGKSHRANGRERSDWQPLGVGSEEEHHHKSASPP